jgi:hypothetical protein
MQRMQRVAIGLMAWALTLAAAAQQPIIYPARGQSAQKQNTDTAECQLWAKQTTGVDPVAIAQQGANQPAAPQQQGGMLKGAAGGAALGAIGAVVGTAAGGLRQRRRNEAAAGQQQANNQQASQQMATFSRAVGACMTGRGYTVQ